MKNYILGTGAGDSFDEVAKKSKQIAIERNITVEFDFNGVICLVNSHTNTDLLYRDYSNSWTMEWKQVGPDCLEKYPDVVQKDFEARTAIREKKQREQEEQYRIKENKERELVASQIKGIDLEIIPEKIEEYKIYVENNSKDGYSRGVVDYAEGWAKLMQVEISKGKSVRECADETQKNLGYLGITGFMYGCAVKALSHFWVHGEDLRKWHNKKYGVSEDKKGVVNPAVLTISV